jgi:asparagine synthase (glutamine-hydrolysing)
MVFDQTDESEKPYIDAVLERGGFAADFVNCTHADPLDGMEEMLAIQDGPFNAMNLGATKALYASAERRGLAGLLDGHGGDEVVSHGEGLLREQAQTGAWRALWREARMISSAHEVPAWPIFWFHWRRFSHSGQRLVRAKDWLQRRKTFAAPAPQYGPLINPALAEKTDLAARYENRLAVRLNAATTERERHAAIVLGPEQPAALEELDRIAARSGVAPLYPFFDKDLIAFCVALPAAEKRRGATTRLVQREAMRGVVPDKVRQRSDKHNFAPFVRRRLIEANQALIEAVVLGDAFSIAEYFNLKTLADAYDRLKDWEKQADARDIIAVVRAVSVALWLRGLRVSQDRPLSAEPGRRAVSQWGS